MGGDSRYCAPVGATRDYVSGISELPSYSVQVPISSRWENIWLLRTWYTVKVNRVSRIYTLRLTEFKYPRYLE